jgi:hypothetical protein
MKFKLNWGKGLVIFFIIFFAWVLFFVLFALRQTNDLVTDDYYQQGAKYTDQININQRSAPYQDSIQISSSGKQIQIVLSKTITSGNDSIEVFFFRSSDKTKDLKLSFSKSASPFLVDETRLLHGRYLVFFSWNERKEKYNITKTVDVE